MTDDAWSNFIASINPADLESERMRVHSDLDHERPGSRWDHEMRHAHDYCRRDFWERMRSDVTTEQADMQLADADREIHARGYDIPDKTEIDAAIRSYAIRQAARAAERKAA
jgi:hypothetical protein